MKENKTNWNSNTGYLQGPRFTANIPGIQSFVRISGQRNDIKKGTDITSHGNAGSGFEFLFDV